MKLITTLLVGLVCLTTVYSQPFFNRYDSVVVRNILGIAQANPWAGGFNSVQFSEIDLNFDGIKDVHVFDKSGNKNLTFLNVGTNGTAKYVHAPKYQNRFPRGTAWAMLRDMDCDGLEDYLTYYPGGISLYKNISTPGNIQFKLLEKKLQGYHPNLSIPWHDIFTLSVDYPAIDDIDNDGDLDILVWDQFGSTVSYYKNQSLELYGTCDSLSFETKNSCWGYFNESAFTNQMNLNFYSCWLQVPNPESSSSSTKPNSKGNKHQGGTMLTLDLDGDTVKELIVGDISYPNLIALANGGALDSAHMDSQDTLFPSLNSSTIPVDLPLCPASFYLDVDNDSIKDLLVSPFALTQIGSMTYAENQKSVWYYKNNGTNAIPDFAFQSTEFIQNGMMDHGEGAYPQFFDYNNDSLLDIVVGNYGYFNNTSWYESQLALYENIGTSSKPEFRLITRDFGGLKSLILDTVASKPVQDIHPTFGDMDGDGDEDMFIGEESGRLHYFENTAPLGTNAIFSLDSMAFQNIDIGESSAPTIVDLNRDGLLDLVVGERTGNLNYFENTGSSAYPAFTLITDTLGSVDTKGTNVVGYSKPDFVDSSGTYTLHCGSVDGGIYRYTNIDGNLTGNFTLVTDTFKNIWEGSRSAPSFADIDNDGLIDFVTGNYSGGIALFKGDIIDNVSEITSIELISLVSPNPSNGIIDISVTDTGTPINGSLYSLLGKLQQKFTFNSKYRLDLSNHNSGSYVLILNNGALIKTHKVILTK